jgi:endonuclease/exonuclease/phosphatase family metal-dependent hydrolase
MKKPKAHPEKLAAPGETPSHFSSAGAKYWKLIPTDASSVQAPALQIPTYFSLASGWQTFRKAHSCRWIAIALLGAVTLFGGAAADESKFVRFSKPQTLSFAELVQLSETESAPKPLTDKMDTLLRTPFVSNEAYLDGVKPIRPSSEALGPVLRAAFWNIERGIELDSIKIVLTKPDQFDKVLADKKEPAAKPLTAEQLTSAKAQLALLQGVDLLILNEVDSGVTRTDYRDVARELAEALHMNYAYGVEFLEVDPLNLGLEKVKLDDKAAQDGIQKSFDPDKERYLGLHGTAVLSRYPIRSATVRPLPVCHDWYNVEKKEVSKLEAGKRSSANLVFMERITREVRRGGRMAMFVELAVPESDTGAVTVVATHLENKCKPECRRTQMQQILDWGKSEVNPVILAGDMNTTAMDSSPTSASKVIKDRLKDPDAWARSAIKWSTGAPTILLVPINFMRNKNDPTGFDVPVLSRKKEAKLFGDLDDFHFADGHTFDFRGEASRSAEDRGGTLSDSNQRAGKGFQYTFALARTYGGLVGQYKLDWFFVKGYATDSEKSGGSYKFAPHFAQTLQELNEAPDKPLSDHSPITVDIPLADPPLKSTQQ